MKALVTRKIGMTSTISEDGMVQAVTLLSATPNVVTQVKSIDSDGYNAIQLGFEKVAKMTKAQIGHFKKSKVQPKVVREIRVDDETSELVVGNEVKTEIFSIGDKVNVTSKSKGKGWAGTIKRHNFSRGRKTHGGRSYRRPGSIGSMYPQKIFKGKKMAGQMGAENVTTRNLKVVLIDNDLQVIGVSGSVPGPRKSIVVLRGVK